MLRGYVAGAACFTIYDKKSRLGSPHKFVQMSLGIFYGRARAHLLNVGIIRPAAHVSAIDINAFLSDDAGAPVNCGKISDQDKSDVPRFLNRQGPLAPLNSAPG